VIFRTKHNCGTRVTRNTIQNRGTSKARWHLEIFEEHEELVVEEEKLGKLEVPVEHEELN
jgi:Uri superfamily endonuclease